MTNALTCSREQLDWAIGVIDEALTGKEVDANQAFKAGAILGVLAEAAFGLTEEVERLRALQSLSGVTKTMAQFVAEIERLEAEVKRLNDLLPVDCMECGERAPSLKKVSNRYLCEVCWSEL